MKEKEIRVEKRKAKTKCLRCDKVFVTVEFKHTYIDTWQKKNRLCNYCNKKVVEDNTGVAVSSTGYVPFSIDTHSEA